MKINAKQKAENRRKIIRAAVEAIIEKGYKSATMRCIAKSAGLGEATIYNYFPTKESILYAYYLEHFENCIEQLLSIEDFNKYAFQEQLQTFFEFSLELLLPDREFVGKSFKVIFFSMSHNIKHLKPIRTQFINIVDDIFQAAIEVGEIPDQVFQEIIYQLFFDYYVGIVTYWLNDTSEQFKDTTLFLDKSMDLTCTVLKTNLFNKCSDLAVFLFKNHVLNRMHFAKDKIDTVDRIKRMFTGGVGGK